MAWFLFQPNEAGKCTNSHTHTHTQYVGNDTVSERDIKILEKKKFEIHLHTEHNDSAYDLFIR